MSKAQKQLLKPLERLMQGETVLTGLSRGTGRDGKLKLKREHDSSGFETYTIENVGRRETLHVPRFLFEFFRSAVGKALKNLSGPDFPEVNVEFKGRIKFRIELQKNVGMRIIALDPREGAQGTMHLTPQTLKTLWELLNDDRAEHGSDVLKRILAYHKLFKFTFSEASDSLNSGLALRTDVLSQVEDYMPPVGKRSSRNAVNLALTPNLENLGGKVPRAQISKDKSSDKNVAEAKVFKSRLAERDGGKAWKVDYQSLFSNESQRSVERQPRANTGEESKREGAPRHTWLVPLLASEVKSIRTHSWRCELSSDDIKLMRDSFLESRDSEYYLGFDIVDAIYKSPGGKLKTFRFPLYYLPIEVQESGRVILLEPLEGGRFYLNHLAIATLVESFSSDSNPETAITEFFETLLAQRIEVDGRLGRVYLSRTLPCSEDIFDRTREVLLGLPGENGKGGLFGSLEMLGAECDTDAVFLYMRRLPRQGAGSDYRAP